jgi:hypothetical protein
VVFVRMKDRLPVVAAGNDVIKPAFELDSWVSWTKFFQSSTKECTNCKPDTFFLVRSRLDLFDHLTKEMKAIEERLTLLAEDNERARLLMIHPGVGVINALTPRCRK